MTQRLLVLCSLLLLVASSAFAQDSSKVQAQRRADFSGTWIPSVEKEKRPNAKSDEWTNMIIEQRDPELKFTLIHPNPDGKTTRKLEFTFYTDGRGETNNGTVYYFLVVNKNMADEAVKSTTRWEGDALVVVHRMVSRQGRLTVSSDLTMRWELSGDGQTLTRTIATSNYSALYLEPGSEKEKAVPVNVKGAGDKDFKDTYVRLKAKR